MTDFLLFDRFITPYAAIFIYYIGALFIPLSMIVGARKLYGTLLSTLGVEKSTISRHTDRIPLRYRVALVLAILILFLSAELFWRMLFEMVVAYFDMHGYLREISRSI
jgi:hypothetical protein